jgi:hypothetical protein
VETERKSTLAAVILAAFVVIAAGVFVQYRLISAPGLPTEPNLPPVSLKEWLPAPGRQHGALADTFPGPFTPEGLRDAARLQFRIAQAMENVSGHSVWHTGTCEYAYLGWGWVNAKSHRLTDLALVDVRIPEFSERRSRVELVLRYKPDPRVNVRPFEPYTDIWDYDGKNWRNHTCGYNLGPPWWTLFRLAESPTPTPGATPSPTLAPNSR